MKTLASLVAILLATSISLSAKSDVYDQGLAAAVKNTSSTIQEFTELQLNKRTQSALNAMVATANEALAERGFVEMAQTSQREWDRNYASYFTSYYMDNIGDHAPLSSWLATYYEKTRDRLGDPVMKFLHLDDLWTINYTFPVALHPKGDTKGQDHWNQLEYKVHFVPFASIVTYWGSFGACRVIALKYMPLKRFCKNISMILRSAMKSSVAPKLSDYIYVKFSGKAQPKPLNFTDAEEYYQQEVLKIQK